MKVVKFNDEYWHKASAAATLSASVQQRQAQPLKIKQLIQEKVNDSEIPFRISLSGSSSFPCFKEVDFIEGEAYLC